MKKVMNVVLSVVLLGMLMILFAGCNNSSTDESGSASVKLSSAKAITEFSIDGVEGTINEEAKTIAVVMPSGTSNLTSLIATYTTTGSEVDIEGVGQESGQRINDFTNPVIYTVTAENGSKLNYKVTVTVAPSSAKAITTFSLGGVEGTINETGKTIAASLPLGTDVTAMMANFTTTGVSVKVGSIIQTTGLTPNNFTNPVVYTVTASDATTQDYTVTVTLADQQKATAITVSLKPNDEGTSVPEGVFCTRTSSITATIAVADIDGDTNVTWEWYDNDILRSSGQTEIKEANGTTTTTIVPPFTSTHTIKFVATADGVVSNSISAQITCGKKYAQ